MWCPQDSVQLVHITLITRTYGRYIELVNGIINQLRTGGAPPCRLPGFWGSDFSYYGGIEAFFRAPKKKILPLEEHWQSWRSFIWLGLHGLAILCPKVSSRPGPFSSPKFSFEFYFLFPDLWIRYAIYIYTYTLIIVKIQFVHLSI